jgi:predicted GNAT family acetyltransferase
MSETEHAAKVVLNPEAQRYELWSGDRLDGFASFRELPGKIEIYHTVILPELEEQGLGSQLVAAALDDARAKGLAVIPTCSFVGFFISEHPEYADLLAA